MILSEMIGEIRREFQIPPYFSDDGIYNYIKEGMSFLGIINPVANIEEDNSYRSLLKNYVYYAYHHKVDDFQRNYKADILSWQLGSEVK